MTNASPMLFIAQRFAFGLLVNQPQILISLAVLRGLQERRLREAAEREAAAEALAAAAVEEDLAATRAELATVSAELAAEMQPRAVAATASDPSASKFLAVDGAENSALLFLALLFLALLLSPVLSCGLSRGAAE